jgi:hypothetical protein
MKVTLQLSISFLRKARELAARGGATLAVLIEKGLRRVLAERRGGFRLRDASFKGCGLHPEFRDADWNMIRDAIYEPRVSKR